MEKKNSRILDIFFRGLRGEALSVKELAEEYEVSTKSISRDFSELKNYLAEHREIVGNTEWEYSNKHKRYTLTMDGFLESKELYMIVEILLATRTLSSSDLNKIVGKIKSFTTSGDSKLLDEMIAKEMYHYNAIQSDCHNIIDHLWTLARVIKEKKEITIHYYKMDRSQVERRIIPLSIVFSEYYFYLIAYHKQEEEYQLRYYRIDRIESMVEHRKTVKLSSMYEINEGELKNKIQFMWPGRNQKIVFEFCGPSVQAILDRLPTAKIIKYEAGVYQIEAEVYGDGIIMYLLSQGDWVKVLSPESLKIKMQEKIKSMLEQYN